MKLFGPRKPPGWGVLIAAAILLALGLTGLVSGVAVMPGRHSNTRVVAESVNHAEFVRIIRLQLGLASVLTLLGFIRVVPVEDFFRGLRRQMDDRMKNDRTPAPLWAYLFLAAFIGLVIWIGRITMYAE